MYLFLDKFFFVFHTVIIFFNLFGWIWKKTRKFNLILLLLTAFSWFILGIWYGFGFCPSTEWHWKVRVKLELYDMPLSYIKFFIDSITDWNVNARMVDMITLLLFLTALILSIIFNVKDRKLKDKQKTEIKKK
ncbi:MAG: DUF2784 family protein [Candidatus Aminicenantes bacterium]|nr:DUF2784 family protein [Candidatus Aminicenantes bacterium]